MTESKAEQYLNDDSFNEMLKEARGEKPAEPQHEQEVVEESTDEAPSDDVDDTTLAHDMTEQQEVVAEEPAQESYRIPKERLDAEAAKRYAAEELVKQQQLYIEKLMAQLNQPKAAEAQHYEEPELNVLDEDAHRYYTSQQKKLEAEINKLKQVSEQNKLESAIMYATNEFKSKTPDYQTVVNKYLEFKKEEAIATFGDDAQANEFLDKQLEHLSKNALANGKNPAEILFNLAKKTVAPTVAKVATQTAKPNLDALNANMPKSKTAPTNNSASTMPTLPANLKELGADYFTDEKKFNQLLAAAKARW